MSVHKPIGGSKFDRLSHCPNSMWMTKDIPNRAGFPAKRGTALHELFEKCQLEPEYEPDPQTIVVDGEEIEITEDDILECLYPALDALAELYEEFNVTQAITEEFFDVNDNIGGTADVLALGTYRDKPALIIADLKTGSNPVDASTSAQLPFYAACAFMSAHPMTSGVRYVVYAIIQPTDRVSYVLNYHIVEFDEVLRFGNHIKEVESQALLAEKYKLMPTVSNLGPGCRWCEAAPNCPAAQYEESQYEEVSTVRLGSALTSARKVNEWAKRVEELAKDELAEGHIPMGWETKPGRRVKTWTSSLALKNLMNKPEYAAVAEEVLPTTPKTPAQTLKIFKRHGLQTREIEALISYSQPGTVLVPKN